MRLRSQEFRALSVIRPIFNKLVRSHLDQGKQLAEARAERSRVYPKTSS